MDEFKQYLKQHEAELDTEKPGVHVWEQVKLKQGKPASRIFMINTLWKYAAAIILLMLIGFTIKYISGVKKHPLPEAIALKIEPISNALPDTTLTESANATPTEKIKKAGIK
ncbi:MAG: hypothetical protein EOO01_02150, partial [Chitinophagaceae bacterium]